jgi:hypothetical protein
MPEPSGSHRAAIPPTPQSRRPEPGTIAVQRFHPVFNHACMNWARTHQCRFHPLFNRAGPNRARSHRSPIPPTPQSRVREPDAIAPCRFHPLFNRAGRNRARTHRERIPPTLQSRMPEPSGSHRAAIPPTPQSRMRELCTNARADSTHSSIAHAGTGHDRCAAIPPTPQSHMPEPGTIAPCSDSTHSSITHSGTGHGTPIPPTLQSCMQRPATIPPTLPRRQILPRRQYVIHPLFSGPQGGKMARAPRKRRRLLSQLPTRRRDQYVESPEDGTQQTGTNIYGDISGNMGLVSAGRINKDTPPLTTPSYTSKSSAMDTSSHIF